MLHRMSLVVALNDGTHFGGWLSLSGSNGHAPLKRADRIDANDPKRKSGRLLRGYGGIELLLRRAFCLDYFNPITMESGPTRCSTCVFEKPDSRIHCWQSAPV